MKNILFTATIIVLSFLKTGCSKEGVSPFKDTLNPDYMAVIDPADFTDIVDNSFSPFTVGSTFTYIGEKEEGTERIEIEVLDETKIILGIKCTVVRDRAFLNEMIIEDTFDWFAQDKDGNVWYFGEQVDNYVNGVIDNHDGSWEAGVDGAEPGFLMLGQPVPGLHYRQEFYKGIAEDRGEVVSKNATVSVKAGTFTGCIKIRETNALEPDFLEFKYYAPGVGLIKVEAIDDPVEVEELVSYNIKG